MCFFKTITARDMFMEFYNQHLLRRVISGNPLALEIERYILNKFTDENGEEFIKQSETIISTHGESRELIEAFHESTGQRFRSAVEFNPLVFPSQCWPFKGNYNLLQLP